MGLFDKATGADMAEAAKHNQHGRAKGAGAADGLTEPTPPGAPVRAGESDQYRRNDAADHAGYDAAS